MISHDNLVYTAKQNTDFFKWEFGVEKVLSYLPQNHMAGMMMDQMMVMTKGGICCFADKNALKGTLLDNIQHFRPTRFMGVTRIFEKIEEGIKKKGADTKGLKRMVADWAKNQSLHHHKQEESGKPHSSIGYTVAKKLIFSKVGHFTFLAPHTPLCSGSRCARPEPGAEARLRHRSSRRVARDCEVLPQPGHEAAGDDQPGEAGTRDT